MRIIEGRDQAEAVKFLAESLYEHLQDNPKAVIGVATGNTMIPVYAELVSLLEKNPLNISEVHWVALDEYVGVPSEHASSFKSYLKKHLANPLAIAESNLHLPSEGNHYEDKIKSLGGIDLQLLGVGVNGHIGFNEPGSTKNSRTRIVKLDTKTLESNKPDLKDLAHLPDSAISMGVGTILEAKKIILLATGHSKREAIHHLLRFEDRTEWPVTFLKTHPHFILMTDPQALPEEYLKI